MRAIWGSIAVLVCLALAGWGGYRLWPRELSFHPTSLIPVWERVGDRETLTLPGRYLVAEVGLCDDELFAYLMFQHLRGADTFQKAEVLLTYLNTGHELVYPIQVYLENDLLTSIPLLARAEAGRLIEQFEWRYVTENAFLKFRYQTHLFESAYNMTSRRKLEHLTDAELTRYVRRFLRFKSMTDPRIRRQIEPVPRPLSNKEASRLASDIVTIADFYSIPLDFFLGIGAMENNYMDVKGDLEHAIWKRRKKEGDIVLKRRRGRVLVLNPASGVWQITRETLRHVHDLYLKDTRDYSSLPEHLRPPKELKLDEPNPEVLTTYAGLLFRHLLDEFNGDVALAVGAYNGGPKNPNARYEAGVRLVAQYARKIVEQAAVLNGRPAAGTRFLRSK